ncbi:MAG: hypothetical protein WAN43_00035, partial [Rhodomicrobium sp.]
HRSLSAIRPDYKAGHAISLLLEEKILRQNQFSEKLDFSHSLGRVRTSAPIPGSACCWRLNCCS